MSEQAGVIYIFSNPAMPGLVKLGKTTNLSERLKSLDGTGVPVPFQCVFAKRVGNYHEVERPLWDEQPSKYPPMPISRWLGCVDALFTIAASLAERIIRPRLLSDIESIDQSPTDYINRQ